MRRGFGLSGGGKYAPQLGGSTECAPGAESRMREEIKERKEQGDGKGSKQRAHGTPKEKWGKVSVCLIPGPRGSYVHLS
jgi:hypothetical protein